MIYIKRAPIIKHCLIFICEHIRITNSHIRKRELQHCPTSLLGPCQSTFAPEDNTILTSNTMSQFFLFLNFVNRSTLLYPFISGFLFNITSVGFSIWQHPCSNHSFIHIEIQSSFSTSIDILGQIIHGNGESVLCIVGGLKASPVSTHQTPVAILSLQPQQFMITEKYRPTLPNVFWEATSSLVRTTAVQSSIVRTDQVIYLFCC